MFIRSSNIRQAKDMKQTCQIAATRNGWWRALAIMAMAVFSGSASRAAEDTSAQPTKQMAAKVIKLLASNEGHSVALLMHYPPSYTKSELDKDISDVEISIGVLEQRFGTISDIVPDHTPGSGYELGIGGGTIPYWKSLSPLKIIDSIYSVRFSKFGHGDIDIRMFRRPGPVSAGDENIAIQSIVYRLPADRANSKQEAIAASKDLMRAEGMALPSNIDQLLSENLNAQPVGGGVH